MVIGDLNVDQWQDNEPLMRPEIKALQPVFDSIVITNGLKRMNNKPTRFSSFQKPSLLDVILSSDPQSISKVDNVKTGLSDHDGLICQINCKDVLARPQFNV